MSAATKPADLAMLLRVLANPPRPRDSRNTRACWASYAGDALALASRVEAESLTLTPSADLSARWEVSPPIITPFTCDRCGSGTTILSLDNSNA